MNIEHRLQHAARELREVVIDVPPLGEPTSARHGRPRPLRVLQALAAPVLFVAGGLFAVGAIDTTPAGHAFNDASGPSVAVAPPGFGPSTSRSDADRSDAPTVRAELEMIAEIVNSNRRANEATTAAVTQQPDDALPLASSRAETFGPL